MVNVFGDLIREFQTSKFTNPPSGSPSPEQGMREAMVFIGMSNSTKEWILYRISQDLLTSGVDATKLVYINFTNERLQGIQKINFQDILTSYFEIYPEYRDRTDIHFFFDEIHEIPGWDKFISQLLKEGHMQIYLTGSSNKMLSQEVADSFKVSFTGSFKIGQSNQGS